MHGSCIAYVLQPWAKEKLEGSKISGVALNLVVGYFPTVISAFIIVSKFGRVGFLTRKPLPKHAPACLHRMIIYILCRPIEAYIRVL